ncbi:hypothetical protein BUZ15_14155 [Staphylococcus gallinarum]|uniref:Phage PVL protein n=1 Tax=Staphylococcus gallinarum TaxID=1293 RepID=A0A2T4STX4_STAGA|nr:hypothetical protein [Staphylococcus gallinarum]PTL07514.1 hypothetical protein BUZ15_14155 [Staphylococcus gallinarum]RIL33168.1 hypothetical protein BUY98_08255 [Staphylococcus gallinarum]RIL41063.1 hypothetical protein BUZ01_13705 [Staphylococcus gallinarum]RIO94181.1 hypothetical protein BUZ04_03960 [Staphylococcus gallinarum]
MKIKTRKQLNLPQLIEWAMKNDMHERSFCGDRYGDAVHFDENEDMLCDHVSLTETFTVEVEEEITEDTVLPKLVERWKHDDEGNEAFRYVEHDDKSINKVLFVNPESVEATHFYIENDNRELVLIWRDGKLVE